LNIVNQIKSYVVIALCATFTSNVLAQDYFYSSDYDSSKVQIVLFHPTVSNIEHFRKLIEYKIINDSNIHFIGVYHANETYDYRDSEKYLKKNPLPCLSLYKITESIIKDSLYRKNACSDVFYKIFKHTNGMIFNGGPDIPPEIYGDSLNPLSEITDPYRHYFEVSFLFHLLGGSQNQSFKPFLEEKPNYHILAICLGMQSMNVAIGGTLIQDIPSVIYNKKNSYENLSVTDDNNHSNYWSVAYTGKDLSSGWYHQIKLIPKTFFSTVLKFDSTCTPLVYSSHHQCIKKLANDLQVVATSMDGKVIEAVIHKKYKNVIGVQFHPEKSFQYDSKYKIKLDGLSKPVFINEILVKDNTIAFYQKLWNYFMTY